MRFRLHNLYHPEEGSSLAVSLFDTILFLIFELVRTNSQMCNSTIENPTAVLMLIIDSGWQS